MKSLGFTLILLCTWAIAHQVQVTGSSLPCRAIPNSCAQESIYWAADRAVIGLWETPSDHFSTTTQNLAGALAILAPFFLLQFRWMAVLKELLLLLQATALNGTLNELLRWIIQRPRPFVYTDLNRYGTSPHHYTSFYSGHTSFAALASTCLVILCVRQNKLGKLPHWGAALAVLTGAILTGLTAYHRVLAGKHFPSDVIAGMLIGASIAYGVHRWDRKKEITT